MPRSHFKAIPSFSSNSVNVDREGGSIKNINIANHGLNKNGTYFNDQFMLDLVDRGNDHKQGVKCRFGHPNMCSTTLGTFLGRYRNFRLEGKKVFADLSLDPISKKTQVEGKGISMYDYVMDMAESNPDMFGNSIHITSEIFEEIINEKVYYSHKLENIVASDLVDHPAATDSLFDFGGDMGVAVTRFLDENPNIFEVVQKDPSIIDDFFSRYFNYLKTFKKDLDMGILDSLKKKFGRNETFDVDETTATGDIITVKTEDETPKVGDPVVDSEGNALPDGDVTIKDGSIWVIADGKISEMKPAGDTADDTADGEPTMAQVMQSVNNLSQSFESFKKTYKKDMKENQDAIDFVADTFEKKFKNLAKTVKSKSPDYQAQDKTKKKFENASGYDPDKVREAREARNKKNN